VRTLLYAVSRRYPICSTHRLNRSSAQYNIQSKIYTAIMRMNGCHENLARSGEREIRERLADQRLSRGYTVPDVRAVPCQTFLIRSAVSGGREPPKKKKKKKKNTKQKRGVDKRRPSAMNATLSHSATLVVARGAA